MTSLVRIDQTLLSNLSQRARQHSRRRLNHNFHEPLDVVNRMLNAIEPDSYICPHRHQHPPLEESFLVLRGTGSVIVFTEVGEVEDILVLDSRRQCWGVEIPAGRYHTILSRAVGSVFYEVKQGPYDPQRAKEFAPWAPLEGTPEATAYLQRLHRWVDQAQQM